MEYAESQGRRAADDHDVVPHMRREVDHDRLNEITGAIVNSALLLHRDLGPGLLESVYESLLARMLQQRGFRVRCQSKVQFLYMGIRFEDGFRVDMLVEDCIIAEIRREHGQSFRATAADLSTAARHACGPRDQFWLNAAQEWIAARHQSAPAITAGHGKHDNAL